MYKKRVSVKFSPQFAIEKHQQKSYEIAVIKVENKSKKRWPKPAGEQTAVIVVVWSGGWGQVKLDEVREYVHTII